MIDVKLLLLSLFAVLTVYFAFRAHKYQVLCQVMLMCLERKYGYKIDLQELREMAKDELQSRFRK